MPSKVLKLKADTSSLGTTITLSTHDGSYNIKLAEYLENNPLSDEHIMHPWLEVFVQLSQIGWHLLHILSAFATNPVEQVVEHTP